MLLSIIYIAIGFVTGLLGRVAYLEHGFIAGGCVYAAGIGLVLAVQRLEYK